MTTKHTVKNYTDLLNGEGGSRGLGLPRAPFFLKLVLTIRMDHKPMCPWLSVTLVEEQIMSSIMKVQTKYTSKKSKMGRPCSIFQGYEPKDKSTTQDYTYMWTWQSLELLGPSADNSDITSVSNPGNTEKYRYWPRQTVADVHAHGHHEQQKHAKTGSNKDPGYRIPGLFVSTKLIYDTVEE